MTARTKTEYAFDYGDEVDDFTIDGGLRDDAEALRRSALITADHTDQPDLWAHNLVRRTVTLTTTDWEEVS